MNTKNLSLKAILLLLVCTYNFTACSDSSNDENSETETPNEPVSLYTYFSNDPDYSLLVQAIDQIGYNNALNVDGAGSYTFFAPNNEAFSRYLAEKNINSIQNIPTNTLTQIILNHMLSGKAKFASEITEGYNKTQAKEYITQANIDLFVAKKNSTITLNDGILITKADIEVTNGIIHKIDDLITPATLATFIKVDSELSNLYNASKELDNEVFTKLNDIEADITVFIPSEEAFLDMGTVTLESLNKTIKYHIIDGEINTSNNLKDGDVLNTWQGNAIKINTGDSIIITDSANENATIIAKDFVAWNGVAHIINKVLKYE